jgi:hypothetical protein
MTRMKTIGTAFLFLVAASTVQAAGATLPSVTSITGYSDGFTVLNGRYTGQIIVPQGGTNRYKNFLASDCYYTPAANPYYWDINGTNFGSTTGSLSFGFSTTNPSPFTSVTIVSWTSTKIRVKVVTPPLFLSCQIALRITTSTGQSSAPFNDNVAGTSKGRGAGQCTWYAACMRWRNGLSIPPTPWGTDGSIPGVGALDNGYRPQLWDCVIYAGHIAIITTKPVQTTNADGSLKWTFTVSEYNAQWTESLSTSTRIYAVSKPASNGRRTVTAGIGTNLSVNRFAYGYYR